MKTLVTSLKKRISKIKPASKHDKINVPYWGRDPNDINLYWSAHDYVTLSALF